MFAQFPKKSLFSKLISGLAVVSFIITSVPVRSYAALGTVDKLRAPVVESNSGMIDSIERELSGTPLPNVKIFAENFKVGGKTTKEQEKNVGQIILLSQLLERKLAGALLGHSATREDCIKELTKVGERLLISGGIDKDLAKIKIKEIAENSFNSAVGPVKIGDSTLGTVPLIVRDAWIKTMTKAMENLLTEIPVANDKARIEAKNIASARFNEVINHRILALLDAGIKDIPICVGGSKEEILAQLNAYFNHIPAERLKDTKFYVANEPPDKIGKVADAGGKDVAADTDEVRDVHQAIYNLLEVKYGKDIVNSIWGKSFLMLYGASVDGKNIDRIMSVKSNRPDMAGVPLVHGVLFASSGKKVPGFLAVAKGVSRAAIADNNKYVCFVNLKAFDNKDKTPPDQFLAGIYEAINKGEIDASRTSLFIAEQDSNLGDWQQALAKAEAEFMRTNPKFLLASLNMAELKEILASDVKSAEILDGIAKKLNSLPKAEKLELSRLEAVVVLGKLANLTETETFSRIRKIVHRLSAEQLAALKGIAKADLFKNDDLDRKLAIALKPTNIFVSAGNAVIFSEGAFNSWLNEWEPGQNIVAIKTLKGAKQLNAAAFVRQNFYSGGVFARYQVAGLHLGEPVNVDGKKIDTIIVPEDKNSGRPEMRILYFGPEISNKDAVGIMRQLGIGPDVVAEYGPGKDEGGGKGGTYQALRIKEFIQMGLPVACASPVNKDGIKVGLKAAGLNPKIAFKEALFSFNRDKVTSNTWAVDTLSCTSNAMISAIVAAHEAFGVESGSGETVHAQTASNAVFPEPSGRERDPVDVLRGFSIIQDIQEASTGAAKNLFKIIPELEGNFPITAKRVGAITGSAFTITMNLKKEVTEKEVRDALRNFAKNKSNGMVRFYEGIPGVAGTPLDTNSIVGWSSVSIIDGFMIQVLNNKKTIIIKGLYDNQSAAPGQIAHRWAPWMVDARRAKEILTPAPVQIKTTEVATVPYMSSWGKAELEGKSVLERVDLNVSGAKGEIKSTKKIFEAVRTMVYPLENGAKTVVVISHNGRPDGKVDKAYSMGPISVEIQKALEAQGYNYKAVFHENSITAKGLAKGLKQRIIPGAINILEDSRFYEGEEGNDPSFAAGLADLVDNEVFIFDAFGAAERTGGSLDLVANYVEKIALGLIMENEDKNLQLALQNLHGVIIGGGPKVSEKVPMLQKVIPNMKEGGFLMIGTGPVAPFLKALHNIEVGAKVGENDLKQAQSIIDLSKQYNIKLALPSDFVVVNMDLTKPAEGSEKSWLELKKIPQNAKIYHVTLEQLKQGTFADTESGDTLIAKNLFIYDIYKQSIEEFSKIILQTPAGRWNVWNGALGVSEIPQFEVGSKEVGKTCLEAAKNKANIGLVGSDTGAMAEQFGISGEGIYISTGGSSALAVMQAKELLVMIGLKKAQALIDIANGLKVSAKKVRDFLLVNKASLETLSDKNLIAAISTGVKAKDVEKEAEKVETAAGEVMTRN
ncbi:MAG: phosphoglycerate kinase [Candidatus Omnitrophica bacterium]|nr:phosphoglycerate kinase [Candidatus Omnitrophota bacterium]